MKYVVGFIFSPDFEKVLLIKKTKPAWQDGLLNGIGGKIEPKEDSLDAMIRECKEECDLDITDWTSPVFMKSSSWYIDIYYTLYNGNLDDAKTLTAEEVAWYPVKEIVHNGDYNCLVNLPFLIQGCIAHYLDASLAYNIITYLD